MWSCSLWWREIGHTRRRRFSFGGADCRAVLVGLPSAVDLARSLVWEKVFTRLVSVCFVENCSGASSCNGDEDEIEGDGETVRRAGDLDSSVGVSRHAGIAEGFDAEVSPARR